MSYWVGGGPKDFSLVPEHPILVLIQASAAMGKVQAQDDRPKVCGKVELMDTTCRRSYVLRIDHTW